jgi:CheY-like chemotaxis protein
LATPISASVRFDGLRIDDPSSSGRSRPNHCRNPVQVQNARSSLLTTTTVRGKRLGIYLKRKALEYELTFARRVLGESKVPRDSCLVTDLNMPGMDGLELVDELRQRGKLYTEIPLTGDPNQHVRERRCCSTSLFEKLTSANSIVECIQEVVKAMG